MHPAQTQPPAAANRRGLLAGSLVWLLALGWSGWAPYDRTTWWLEVMPLLLALPLLWATHARFALTPLLLTWVVAHGVVLCVGGAYSYARVPLGFQLQDWLALGRNPYDKIGHFFQGLVPALAAREILLRGDYVKGRRMLAFLVLCTVLAISAAYELVEWWAALALGQGADEFLGTQGDPWDTQSDMFLALLGGISALVLLAPWHDRQLARAPQSSGKTRHTKGGSSAA